LPDYGGNAYLSNRSAQLRDCAQSFATMKIQLELNMLGDGRMFLNYWDGAHGNDLTCQIKDGIAWIPDFEQPEKTRDIPKFLEMVAQHVIEDSIKNQREELAEFEAIENKDAFQKSRIIGIKRWLTELEQIKGGLE